MKGCCKKPDYVFVDLLDVIGAMDSLQFGIELWKCKSCGTEHTREILIEFDKYRDKD